MTDPQNPSATSPDLRTLTHVAYGLFAFSLLTAGIFGVAAIAAIVLIYVKRSDAAGTLYAAHFDWLLRTFWWSVLWLVISFVTTVIFIGYIGFPIVFVWAVYRLIKGWLALLEGRTPNAYA